MFFFTEENIDPRVIKYIDTSGRFFGVWKFGTLDFLVKHAQKLNLTTKAVKIF